jgi:DNA-binding NtrC family response regulator
MVDPGIASPPALPVLYVDDEPENLELFALQFGDDFAVRTADSGTAALEILARDDIAVLLTDERMPGITGIELLARVAERWPDTVRIIVSAYGDAHRLLLAINRGHAHEYILKPWTRDELAGGLDRALIIAARRRQLAVRAELSELAERDARDARGPAPGAAGQVSAGGLDGVMSRVRRAAPSNTTVLITGETGTGKELVARCLHEASPRAGAPFIRVNCGALADGVLESELFGHEAGAFTGAQRLRRGRFELAHGGTIFLDEIGDLPPRTQLMLLRVLQEKEIERVGGATPIKVDARVIAATHRDLPSLIAAGAFREDLYYRLNVIPIAVPPLRERRDDIAALVGYFVAKHAPDRGRPPRLAADVVPRLREYDWPGNVRELENLVQRALVMAIEDTITLDDFCFILPAPAGAPGVPDGPGAPDAPDVRGQARELAEDALRELILRSGGNLSRAARAAGLPRTTLLSRAKRFGLL